MDEDKKREITLFIEKKFAELMDYTDSKSIISIADFKRILKETYEAGVEDAEEEMQNEISRLKDSMPMRF